MEEDIKGIQDYIAMIKRHMKAMLIIVTVLFLFTIVIAVTWPPTYQSTATILIEQQEIPQDLVRSTVTSYADQRIQIISQRVMTSKNLKEIIEKYDLYKKKREKESIATIFERMREDIKLDMVSAHVVDPTSGKPMEATIAFTLSFDSDSPKLAQQVTNELVSLYLNENLKQRTKIAEQAASFLATEAGKYSQVINLLEKKLAEFKESNASSLPELQQLNLQLMDRTDQQIIDVDRQINALTERLVYLEAELLQIDPNTNIYSATGQRIYGASDRLKTLKTEYITLSARYSAGHPDLIKMRKEIVALQKEEGETPDFSEYQLRLKERRAELASLIDRYSSEHPDVKKAKLEISKLEKELEKPVINQSSSLTVKPDNPAYIQLQAQLSATQGELRAMRASRGKLSAKLINYEDRLTQAPQVEREYQELSRDYENATKKYQDIKAKQMEAEISQAMEKDKKGERFSLIEPPLFPENPIKPNRIAIVVLGFVLSCGMAIGYTILRESLDQSIYGSRQVMAITGFTPLVVIPYLETEAELFQKKQIIKRGYYYAGVFLVIAIIIFHFAIKPLDVLWYLLLRKTGVG